MPSLKKMFTTTGIAAILTLTSLAAQAEIPSTATFVKKASMSDMFEIQSSKLALSKSTDDEIKQVAQRMIDDHTKSSASLKDALKSSHSTAKPASHLDASHQKMLTKLKSLKGQAFDSTYIMMQENAHKDAVNMFSMYSADAKEGSLKDFATETLPTLKEHLDHVHQIATRH